MGYLVGVTMQIRLRRSFPTVGRAKNVARTEGPAITNQSSHSFRQSGRAPNRLRHGWFKTARALHGSLRAATLNMKGLNWRRRDAGWKLDRLRECFREYRWQLAAITELHSSDHFGLHAAAKPPAAAGIVAPVAAAEGI